MEACHESQPHPLSRQRLAGRQGRRPKSPLAPLQEEEGILSKNSRQPPRSRSQELGPFYFYTQNFFLHLCTDDVTVNLDSCLPIRVCTAKGCDNWVLQPWRDHMVRIPRRRQFLISIVGVDKEKAPKSSSGVPPERNTIPPRPG